MIYRRTTDRQTVNYDSTFTQWSWSISILTHIKRRKHIWTIQLLPTFRHCTEELPPIIRLHRIRLHVIVTSFKRKNDVTPSIAMNDLISVTSAITHFCGELLSDISQCVTVGSIGEVCLNFIYGLLSSNSHSSLNMDFVWRTITKMADKMAATYQCPMSWSL